MTASAEFHVRIYASPCTVQAGKEISVDSVVCPTLLFDQRDSIFAVTFDEVFEALATRHRLHLELDGAFLWVEDTADPGWKVMGNFYDCGPALQYVEMKGTFSPRAADELFRALGWPETKLLFELVLGHCDCWL